VIREVGLQAFKCFDDRRIPIAPLTLLTGLNAAGKSTVLQALLFLQQALTEGGRDVTSGRAVAPLNGSILRLGAIKDVVDKVKGGSSFAIRIESDAFAVSLDFRASDSGGRDDLSVIVDQVSWKDPVTGLDHTDHRDLLPTALAEVPQAKALFEALAHLRYVPADRVGPAETYPLDNREQHQSLGSRGERAVGALFWQAEEPIDDRLLHPDPEIASRLDRQVEAWLADLFPGVVLELARVPHANLLTLGIRTSEKTDFHRPQHVGFGISYVLPILVALLGAKRGDLVILENPEAHLHPRAQSRLGRLCALSASAGTQVLIETHSEHVLNGSRLAVHDGILEASDVSVLFFTRTAESGDHRIERIGMNRQGQLDNWLPGFFDETERILDVLLASSDGDERA
jgi:predicted ATPase